MNMLTLLLSVVLSVRVHKARSLSPSWPSTAANCTGQCSNIKALLPLSIPVNSDLWLQFSIDFHESLSLSLSLSLSVSASGNSGASCFSCLVRCREGQFHQEHGHAIILSSLQWKSSILGLLEGWIVKELSKVFPTLKLSSSEGQSGKIEEESIVVHFSDCPGNLAWQVTRRCGFLYEGVTGILSVTC